MCYNAVTCVCMAIALLLIINQYTMKRKFTNLFLSALCMVSLPAFAAVSVAEEEPVDTGSEGSVTPLIKERAIINTDFTNWNTVGSNGDTLDITTTSGENITFILAGTSCQPTGSNNKVSGGKVGFLMAEKNANGTITTTAFANITKVVYYHGATGGNRGWGLKKKGENDADWVIVSSEFANPSAGDTVVVSINEENVQLCWYNLADNQNAYMLDLKVYSNVEVTAEQVELTTAVLPADAGKVTYFPVEDSYDKGSVVKLTATEYFGYDFVNWTDDADNVLSTDPVYEHTLNSTQTITANYKKADTYKLNISVEGGANSYMVNVSPTPVMVDDNMMFEAGTVVTLTATSNAILGFSKWNDASTETVKTLTMSADVDVTATYVKTSNYIVGWDFYLKGNKNRPADFYGNDNNKSVTLKLIKSDGTENGWLDKSTVAGGGYEKLAGAAVNWKDIADCYYYQTQINTTGYTNISVSADMLCNYNAYSTQTIEYSLDNSTWKQAGTVTMESVKTIYPLSATLPAEANNVETLYIRFIPDYTSSLIGTTSANDGTAIGNIYITGTVAASGDDPTAVSGIDEAVEVVRTVYYNILGTEVSHDYKGLVVEVKYLSNGEKITTKCLR